MGGRSGTGADHRRRDAATHTARSRAVSVAEVPDGVPLGHAFATRRPRLVRLLSASTDPLNHLRLTPGSPMPTVKIRASPILGVFGQAQPELVGKAVILTDGKAGTVESVWLDEQHGLRVAIRG